MKRRVLVFSSCLFPVRWRRSRARCCEECGARPPARAELSAEGGGLKSKRLRPASGSWTLLDDSNRIALEGTWSARRVNAPAKLTVPHWQGTWQVREEHSRARGKPILLALPGRHSRTC